MCFLAGTEGVPSWNERLETLADQFRHHLLLASPDYQTEHGYPRNAPGKANMTIATNWVCENFGCLAFTLEMPFKDNANLPDDDFGWSGQRSLRLGEAALVAHLCDCTEPARQKHQAETKSHGEPWLFHARRRSNVIEQLQRMIDGDVGAPLRRPVAVGDIAN